MTALGYAHTCATRTGGTLWCWGYNVAGQLGLGGDTDQDLPRQVTTPAAGGWAAVSATFGHTCATRADGTLWCWGKNDFGELGIGGDTDQDLPRQVTG
jgi:alpha-tubulin suppressor-like RCC1 family protein